MSLLTSLLINGGVAIGFLLAFCILRTRGLTKRFYAPKLCAAAPPRAARDRPPAAPRAHARRAAPPPALAAAPRRHDPAVRTKPRALGAGLLSWVQPVLFYPEDDMLRVAGMDVVVMVRLLKYGWVLFAFCTFWCCALLMPLNATGGFLPTGLSPVKGNYTDIDLLSSSNIPPGSHRFWAHLFSVYVVTAVALVVRVAPAALSAAPRATRPARRALRRARTARCHARAGGVPTPPLAARRSRPRSRRHRWQLLIAFSRDVSRLRARYMSTLPRGATSHSVLVTDIPAVDGVGAHAPAAPKALGALAGALEGKPDVKVRAHSAARTALPRGRGGRRGRVDARVPTLMRAARPQDAELGGAADAGSGAHGYGAIPGEDLDPWAGARRQLESGDAEALVRSEMVSTYGADKVAAVNIVRDTRKLDPLLAKYDAARGQLDDITDDYTGKIRRGEEIKTRKQVTLLPAMAPKWAKDKYGVAAKPVKVDALEYLPQQLDHLAAEMKAEREGIKDGLPAAFVTFNDRASANAAATGLHSYDETAWRMEPAPEAGEVIWKNLSMRYKQRVVRSLLMWAAFIALLIFYLPLTAAIQAVVNLDNARAVPGLSVITRLPFVTQVLQGVLPGLVLKIFLIVLPPILAAMARFEGKTSLSQVDFAVVKRFFIFQVFATFIYQFVVGSALSNVQAIVADPMGQIANILGVSAAQTSTFFMTFIMINALAVGMALFRLVPLVIYFIKSKLAGTERAKYRAWAVQPFEFGTQVANHTITLLLGLAFCCLAPLIAPFCLLYFSLALLAQKYQLVYVVTLPYNGGGRMWIDVFHQVMVGVYFLQAMSLAVLLVKRWPYAVLVLPCVAVTAVVHIVNVNLFRRPWTLMSLKEAAVLDTRDHSAMSPAEAEAARLNYLSPVFKVDEAEHARLIAAAAAVDAHLKGDKPLPPDTDDLPVSTEAAALRRGGGGGTAPRRATAARSSSGGATATTPTTTSAFLALRGITLPPSASSRNPALVCGNSSTVERAADVLAFLEALGLAGSADVELMLTRCPKLLSFNVERGCRPVLDFLRQLGLSEEEVAGAVKRFPQVLGYDVKAHLVPHAHYLKSLGLSDEQLRGLVVRRPNVLGTGIELVITYLRKWLRVQRTHVGVLLSSYPMDYSLPRLVLPAQPDAADAAGEGGAAGEAGSAADARKRAPWGSPDRCTWLELPGSGDEGQADDGDGDGSGGDGLPPPPPPRP
ncbi:CSC1-like protein [Scenedesmus sp. PABB004]|nr:CSC1-like protein [Scenedesmus sp. PABB004]